MKPSRPYQFAVMGVLGAAYLAFRLWHLTDSCLWFDEIFSIHAAEHPWNEILSFIALDLIHPPLFYILLKLWIAVGGESLFWLRLFPVIFSVIAIFPFISLCRELKLDLWTRSLALFFFAINGSLIKYAQEVRMYSLLLCLTLFSIWLFARYFNKGKSFVPLLLFNVLLVYTHYFGWLVVVSEMAAILIFQKTKWRRMLGMLAITLVSFVPWIAAIIRAAHLGSGLGQNIGWMTRPGISAIIQFKLNLIEPFYYAASSVEPMSVYSVSIPLLLTVTVAFVLYIVKWKLHSEDEKRTVYLLFIFAIVPVAAAFIASWLLPYSIWGTRHLIIVFGPVSILIAIMIARLFIPTVRTAAITMTVLFCGYAGMIAVRRETPQYSWCAWDNFAVHAAEENSSNIYVFEDLVAYHFWFALSKHGDRAFNLSKIDGIDGVTEDRAYFLPRGFDGIRSVNISEVQDSHIWIAYRGAMIDYTQPPLKTFRDNGYRIAKSEVFAAQGENAFLISLEK